MEVVPEVVCAVHASVAIEYPKIRRLLPIRGVLGFGEVQNDGNSIFVVLSDGALVGGGGVGPDGPVTIFRVLGRLEVADGHEHFGQHGVTILVSLYASFLEVEGLGLDENLLPHDLVDLLHGGLGFGAGLVLVVIIFDV